jgi:hypothetical protein
MAAFRHINTGDNHRHHFRAIHEIGHRQATTIADNNAGDLPTLSCQSTYPSKDRARMNVVLLSDLSNGCAGIQHGADFPALHLSQRGTPPRYFPFCVCSRNIHAAIALRVGDCLDQQRRARPPTIYGFLALKGRWSNSFGIAYSLHSPSTREKIRFP